MAAILGSRPSPGQHPGVKKTRRFNRRHFPATPRKNAGQSRHFEFNSKQCV
jgi:hypothetical protein